VNQDEINKLHAYVRAWTARRPAWRQLSAEAIAEALANDGDFEIIRLAGWLRSADGNEITSIVTMALPYPYSLSARVLADGIKIAADRRTRNERLGVGALTLVVCALLMFGRE
jgi:hypothetical protein